MTKPMRTVLLCSLLVVGALSVDARAAAAVLDRVAAVVGTAVVLQSEVEALLEQMDQLQPIPPNVDKDKAKLARCNEALETLIAEKLLDDEVRKLRVDVTDQEVQRVVQQTMADNKLDEDKLKLALARQGLTLDEYKDGLKKQLTKMKIIQLKVKSRVQVPDGDVKGACAQRRALDVNEYRVRARHILLLVPTGGDDGAAKRKIDDVERALAAGDPATLKDRFAEQAKLMSEDPGSKERGGDLGEFGRGEMVPEFERVAFGLEPGKLSKPVRTPFGWHLVFVEGRVALPQKTDTECMDESRKRLFENELELQFRSYVEELKRNAHVDRRMCKP